MTDLFFINHLILLSLVFLGVVGSLKLLIYVTSRPGHVVGKAVRIPSRKSSTDAIQLGGAPLSIVIGLGMIGFVAFFPITPIQAGMIKVWLGCSALIFIYGYLDDKFELRPVIKLFAQLFAINIFAIYASIKLLPEYSTLAFIILSFWGMGVVNGSNLLDGLDTLTVKLSTVTYGVFFVLGIYHQVEVVSMLSLICLVALYGFYFFNKEPAKIHLGEIGGAYFGFSLILLSSLLCTGAHPSPLSNIGTALMMLSLPMVEVGVSFSRRIMNKKSPFKGDKLHLHYLLRNNYHFSVVGTTWVMSIAYAGVMLISLALSFIHGLIGFGIITLGLAAFSYMVGRKHWLIFGRPINLRPMSLVRYITKRQITLIEPSVSDDFQLVIEESTPTTQHILQ